MKVGGTEVGENRAWIEIRVSFPRANGDKKKN